MKNGNSKLKRLNATIWTCAVILILLTLLTAAVVAIRIGDILPHEVDYIFLIPKEPEFEAFSGNKEWSDDATMEVFKAEYTNTDGMMVTASSNGDAVFAPGSVVSNDIRLRNSGNMAVDYEFTMDFGFLKNGTDFGVDNSPLLVRLYKTDGSTFIVGSADEWVAVADLGVYTDKGTLGTNSYSEYVLEIKWEFERGKDEEDTSFGNLSIGESLKFDLNMSAHVELAADPKAEGGIIDTDLEVVKIGGSINELPFTLLIILMACSAMGLVLAVIKKRKEKSKQE